MNKQELENVINFIFRRVSEKDASEREMEVFWGTYQGQQYSQMHFKSLSYKKQTRKEIGKDVWDRFSRALERQGLAKVTKPQFRKFIDNYVQIKASLENPIPTLLNAEESSTDELSKVLLCLDATVYRKIINKLLKLFPDLERISIPIREIIQYYLQKGFENSITINIEHKGGWIKVTARGSQEDIDRLSYSIKSGELKELNGFRIVGYKLADEETVVQPFRRRNSSRRLRSQVFGMIRNSSRWLGSQVFGMIRNSSRWLGSDEVKVLLVLSIIIAAIFWVAGTQGIKGQALLKKIPEQILHYFGQPKESSGSKPPSSPRQQGKRI